MSGDPDFLDHFIEHAQPQLERLCVAEARCIAAGVETFADAADVVMRHAVQLGGWRLSDGQFSDLHDWVLSCLSAKLDEAATQDEWVNWLTANHIQGGRSP